MEYFSRRVLSGCLQVISVLNYIINVFDDFKFWLGLVILTYLITALVLRGRRPKTVSQQMVVHCLSCLVVLRLSTICFSTVSPSLLTAVAPR
jgi:hypothetical protein